MASDGKGHLYHLNSLEFPKGYLDGVKSARRAARVGRRGDDQPTVRFRHPDHRRQHPRTLQACACLGARGGRWLSEHRAASGQRCARGPVHRALPRLARARRTHGHRGESRSRSQGKSTGGRNQVPCGSRLGCKRAIEGTKQGGCGVQAGVQVGGKWTKHARPWGASRAGSQRSRHATGLCSPMHSNPLLAGSGSRLNKSRFGARLQADTRWQRAVGSRAVPRIGPCFFGGGDADEGLRRRVQPLLRSSEGHPRSSGLILCGSRSSLFRVDTA